MSRTVRFILAGLLSLSLVVVVAAPAIAAVQGTVAWTRIGIYPRTTPEMRSDNHAGPAVPDGTVVTIYCESTGQTVTSDVATTNIWESTNIGWLPNAFVETGHNGFTPGVPRCGAAAPAPVNPPVNPPAPPAADPPPAQPNPVAPPAQPDSTEQEKPYDVGPGYLLPAGDVPGLLLDYYESGQGGTVIVDWSFFAADRRLMDWAWQRPADGIGVQYVSTLEDGDVFFAVGAFSVARTSEHCFAIRDDYNFDPDKIENWPYISYWLKKHFKLIGNLAADFTVRSSGCVF